MSSLELLEKFALGDRDAAVASLPPGTSERYHFEALLSEHRGYPDDLEASVSKYASDHWSNSDVRNVQYRKMVKCFDPAAGSDHPPNVATLDMLKEQLNLKHTHTRRAPRYEQTDDASMAPSRIGATTLDLDTLVGTAVTKPRFTSALHADSIAPGLPAVIAHAASSPAAAYDYFMAYGAPDVGDDSVPVAMVVACYNDYALPSQRRTVSSSPNSMLSKLSLAQLKLLAQNDGLRAQLLSTPAYVSAVLAGLAPAAFVDLETDTAQRTAYLDRLLQFAQELPPVFNEVRLVALFNRLQDTLRANGSLADCKDDLLQYVSIPRPSGYSRHDWLEGVDRQHFVNIGHYVFSEYAVERPMASSDAKLVLTALADLFAAGRAFVSDFEAVVQRDYLLRINAEAQLLQGAEDPSRHVAHLGGAGAVKVLTDRVELELAPHNRKYYAASDPVKVHVFVKNVPKLTVKVFEINTTAVYMDTQSEIATNIKLDGMVPSEEVVYTYDAPPIQRKLQTIELPSLAGNRRGVFVVELIGNGVSSRAMIRKGSLHFVSRQTVAGHLLHVLDETNALADPSRVSLWMQGRYFRPNDKGTIVIPYATPAGAGTHPVIVTLDEPGATDGSGGGAGAGAGAGTSGAAPSSAWSFSLLCKFEHMQESYSLSAGFVVNRESLIRDNRKATVVVRPALTLHGSHPAPLAALEDVTLTVEATDADGTTTKKVLSDFAVADNTDSTVEFPVPYGLRTLSLQLSGRVKLLATSSYQALSVGHTCSLNGIDSTQDTSDVYLGHNGEEYYCQLLGKTGEPLPKQALALEFAHRVVTKAPTTELSTDDTGCVYLGPLTHVDSVSVAVFGRTRVFQLFDGTHTPATQAHTSTRKSVQASVPFTPLAGELSRQDAALVPEHRSRTDLFHCLSVSETGFLEVRGLAAGRYVLTLKHPRRHAVVITVVDESDAEAATGAAVGFFIHDDTLLERPQSGTPLTVSTVAATHDVLRVLVAGGKRDATRVHVCATRFFPAEDVGACMMRFAAPLGEVTQEHLESHYMSGRELGDEHRYVLDRRSQGVYPGNNLPRPGLLLNPWAVGSTTTDTQTARGGTDFDAKRKKRKGKRGAAHRARFGAQGRGSSSGARDAAARKNMDFLAHPGVVVSNVPVDADGVATLPLAELCPPGGAFIVSVVACDTVHTASTVRPVTAAVTAPPFRSLQLSAPFNPTHHYVPQRKAAALTSGDSVRVTIASDTKAEEYDSLGKLYSLYVSVSSDSELTNTFDFLPKWATLSAADKQKKYSQHACHELNLFVFMKDRPFFNRVVAPYLASKRTLTFMDHFLLQRDLSAYLRPALFDTLNAAERALLCGRVAGGAARLPETMRLRMEASPTPADMFDMLFRHAVAAKALDDEDTAGDLLRAANDVREAEEECRFTALGAGAGAGAGGGGGISYDDMLFMTAEHSMPVPERLDCLGDDDLCDGCEVEELCEEADPFSDGVMAMRSSGARQMYQALEKTQEYVEMHYYRKQSADASLIGLNEFWADFAAHMATSPDAPFVSRHALQPATQSLSSMLVALAVVGLPLTVAEGTDVAVDDGHLVFTARAGPALVFYKDLVTADLPEQTTVLVGQNFFDPKDPYTHVRGVQMDKYLTSGEFLTQKVYGCQVVVTNVSCARQQLEVLLQIPQGALPLNEGFVTKTLSVLLGPYNTERISYQFYFPHLGDFVHYPVHVASEGALVACAKPTAVRVVSKPSFVDTTSWEYISQQASTEDLITHLSTANLSTVNLVDLCWRLRDAAVYTQIVSVLRERMLWDSHVWSYAFVHSDVEGMRLYLEKHASRLRWAVVGESFVARSADAVAGVSSNKYEHREYDPLVNARAHQLGASRKIMNQSVQRQYHALLELLCHKPAVTANDMLAVTYHLLLQDRVEEAQAMFARVSPPGSGGAPGSDAAWTELQYKYMAAYLDFFTPGSDPKTMSARRIAAEMQDFPVPKWANKFREVLRQLDEAAGITGAPGAAAGAGVDDDTRDTRQSKLAATEPALAMDVEAKTVKLLHSNLTTATLRFYLMDIELLFSHNPFVSASSSSVSEFSYIRPNKVTAVPLTVPAKRGAEAETCVPLPEEFKTANVMVEAVSGGLRLAQAYFSNTMRVTVTENYGQLKVTAAETGRPLPRVYVKVYSRRSAGDDGQFYKDGYTDLCGRFDYTSISTDELSHVQQFALLVSSAEHGAVVREARPPKQ